MANAKGLSICSGPDISETDLQLKYSLIVQRQS